jgi:hypothetical protein
MIRPCSYFNILPISGSINKLPSGVGVHRQRAEVHLGVRWLTAF